MYQCHLLSINAQYPGWLAPHEWQGISTLGNTGRGSYSITLNCCYQESRRLEMKILHALLRMAHHKVVHGSTRVCVTCNCILPGFFLSTSVVITSTLENDTLLTVVSVVQQIGMASWQAVCGDNLTAPKFNQDEKRNHLVTCFEDEHVIHTISPGSAATCD